MVGQLIHEHIRRRLKGVHIVTLVFILVLFGLLYFLDHLIGIPTLEAQMILLTMGFVITTSYLFLIPHAEHTPHAPVFFFFLLNVLTSALVWATGIFQSPFIILYVILIIVSAQLYHYVYGLFQTFFALIGFVFIYGATTNQILPYHSLLPRSTLDDLFQPAGVILVYSLLYAFMLIFTALTSSSARTLVFRQKRGGDMNMTYQEKIIQDMPLGVFVVDSDMHILSANPLAEFQFPYDGSSRKLTKHLNFGKRDPAMVLRKLAKTLDTRELFWKADGGEKIDAEMSVRVFGKAKKENESFIIFLRKM